MNAEVIRICSVGDIMLCDSPLYASVGIGSNYSKVQKKIFENCKEVFAAADLLIGNYEGVIHKPSRNSLKEKQMACPSESAELLAENGFSILNIANNHCLQHGSAEFLQTEKILEEKGIVTVGRKGKEPYAVEIKGTRFVFISLSLLPERYQPDDIVYENNIETAFEQIKQYTCEKDIVVVCIHWGNEFATYPFNRQVKLAHRFVDAGVSIVLGHHSHVYQGIEEYNNGLILYSQGNLISDMSQHDCRETAIATISISKESHQHKISYKIQPFRINDQYTLEPADGTWFQDRQKELSRVLAGEVSDETYWRMVNKQHSKCSGEFKNLFKRNFLKYKHFIWLVMLFEALYRKFFKTPRSNQFATERADA